MLTMMREFSDFAKKMDNLEERTHKNDQISALISVSLIFITNKLSMFDLILNLFQEMKSSILAEVRSGFEKVDKLAKMTLEKIEVNQIFNYRCVFCK